MTDLSGAVAQVLVLLAAAVATGVARWLARRFPPPRRSRRDEDDWDDDA